VVQSHDDLVAQPEVLTLHWEGPQAVVLPPEFRFQREVDAAASDRDAERERELRETLDTEQGREIWERIQQEAGSRGDRELWRRKLHAYASVKMKAEGTANDYARRFGLNHATVRTWIAEVAKLAYQVGYRLHEDRLVLTGDAPDELLRLRELVNRDAAGSEARAELRRLAPRFRGEDPYFHLNEGHVLRALGRLRESDATLREGLAVAEARAVRSLLWNARGQTFWDCTPESSWPLADHLARAERAFRRAAVLDASTWFPLVNLAQLAADAGDARRCEYWLSELTAARKKMEEPMQDQLARYLHEAEWTRALERRRFWSTGPARWIADATRKGVLAALAALAIALGAALVPPVAEAVAHPDGAPVAVEHGGRGGGKNSGAGGN
jgi:hypothetical protein